MTIHICKCEQGFTPAAAHRWEWANADRTQAVAGDFVAEVGPSHGWRFTHRDFPREAWFIKSAPDSISAAFDAFQGTYKMFDPVARDFYTWLAYQDDPADLTPAEPTTFGYVGDVDNAEGDDWWILHRDDGSFMAVCKYDGVLHKVNGNRDLTWPDVLALGTFTAVER